MPKRATSASFTAENPRPGPGRPPGSPNRVTREAKEICEEMIDSPVYQANLLARLESGKLHPGVEVMVWGYAKGQTTQKVAVTGTMTQIVEDMRGKGPDELLRILAEDRAVIDRFLAQQARTEAPESVEVSAVKAK